MRISSCPCRPTEKAAAKSPASPVLNRCFITFCLSWYKKIVVSVPNLSAPRNRGTFRRIPGAPVFRIDKCTTISVENNRFLRKRNVFSCGGSFRPCRTASPLPPGGAIHASRITWLSTACKELERSPLRARTAWARNALRACSVHAPCLQETRAGKLPPARAACFSVRPCPCAACGQGTKKSAPFVTKKAPPVVFRCKE